MKWEDFHETVGRECPPKKKYLSDQCNEFNTCCKCWREWFDKHNLKNDKEREADNADT